MLISSKHGLLSRPLYLITFILISFVLLLYLYIGNITNKKEIVQISSFHRNSILGVHYAEEFLDLPLSSCRSLLQSDFDMDAWTYRDAFWFVLENGRGSKLRIENMNPNQFPKFGRNPNKEYFALAMQRLFKLGIERDLYLAYESNCELCKKLLSDLKICVANYFSEKQVKASIGLALGESVIIPLAVNTESYLTINRAESVSEVTIVPIISENSGLAIATSWSNRKDVAENIRYSSEAVI